MGSAEAASLCRPEGSLGAGNEEIRWDCRYFSAFDRKLYDVNLETGAYREVAVSFNTEELWAHASGFWEQSDWLQYACEENAFNSLEDFLDGNVAGAAFDRERQLRAYEQIAANHDGTCGEKVHGYIKDTVLEGVGFR